MKVAKIIQMDFGGNHVTLEVSEELLRMTKEAFQLDSIESVSDRHLKYYLTSSLKNALEGSHERLGSDQAIH